MATTKHETPWQRLGDGSLLTEDADVGLGHVVPVAVYTKVLLTLLLLTALTVGAAFMHFGVLNLFIAMVIASVKALLVGLFFMHLRWENKVTWGVAICPLLILLLLIGSTLGDTMEKVFPVGKSAVTESSDK